MQEEAIRKILYGAWKNMEYRCYNENHKYYKDYGGRGIQMCDEWKTFENFYAWSIENGHKKGLTLERVDNSGNYSPSNCKWITNEEQSKNRRGVHEITIDGVTKNAEQWCRVYNLNPWTFYTRYNTYGWDAVKAITTPVRLRKKPRGYVAHPRRKYETE